MRLKTIAERTIPLITFLLGCVAFGGWLLITRADETGISILRQSLWPLLFLPTLLAIPLGIAAAIASINAGDLVHPALAYIAGLIGLVVFEEAIKLRAARLRSEGIQVFALVSLFGIFELAFFKPLLMLGVEASPIESFWILSSTLPAVTMHVLTAAIYAFHFRQNPVAQFAVCSGIHLLFNLAADRYDIVGYEIWLGTFVPLAAIAWWLIPKTGSEKRGNWQSERIEPAALS